MQRSSDNDGKRRVCFDSEVDVVPVDSACDYSPKERSSVWYTSAECRVFKVQYIRENLESNPSARKMDFVRAQRIDAVRDLLLKAQDVQRKQSFRNTTTTHTVKKADFSDKNFDKSQDIVHRNKKTLKKNKYSFTRWLADFYKHHSEACGAAARTRGIENSNTVNECWSCENKIKHKHHHHSHRRLEQRSSADAATITSSQFSQSKRFSVTMGSRSFEDLATLAKDEEEAEIPLFSNMEWKNDGRAGSLKGNFLHIPKRKDLAPNKPKRKNSDLGRKPCSTCGGPSYNSRKENEGGDLPCMPRRHVSTPPSQSDSDNSTVEFSNTTNSKRQGNATTDRVPIRQIDRNDSPPARAA